MFSDVAIVQTLINQVQLSSSLSFFLIVVKITWWSAIVAYLLTVGHVKALENLGIEKHHRSFHQHFLLACKEISACDKLTLLEMINAFPYL